MLIPWGICMAHSLKFLKNGRKSIYTVHTSKFSCNVVNKNETSDSTNNREENGNKPQRDEQNKPKPKERYSRTLPEEPTTCCMSGCANCVWIDYAEKLSEYFKDGGEEAMKQINEKISDPNLKAFILHEFRMRNKK